MREECTRGGGGGYEKYNSKYVKNGGQRKPIQSKFTVVVWYGIQFGLSLKFRSLCHNRLERNTERSVPWANRCMCWYAFERILNIPSPPGCNVSDGTHAQARFVFLSPSKCTLVRVCFHTTCKTKVKENPVKPCTTTRYPYMQQ